MKVVVLQSSYLPWKGYFDLIHDADRFVYYDEVKYTKNDWRNRNKIHSKNGPHWLTVPVSSKAVNMKISEVRLHDHHWQKKHFRSLSYTYSRAPFFGEIEDFLSRMYLQREWELLVELNRHVIEFIARRLGCRTEFFDSRDFSLVEGRVEKLVDLLVQLEATEYVTGPAARAYLEGRENVFSDNGITLVYKNYSGYPEYRQWGQPFEHGVSVIDLIAHAGFDDARWYIWGWRKGSRAARGAPRRRSRRSAAPSRHASAAGPRP